METLEGEEREKGAEEIFETKITEDFPTLMSHTKSQIQETQSIPDRINGKKKKKKKERNSKIKQTKKPTFRHIIVKLQKIKDK